MPSSITHYLFAKTLVNQHITHKDIFFLGSQGPDVFFFYGYHPFIKKNRRLISGFGTELHDIDLTKAYAFIRNYAEEYPNHRDLILSYLKGLFSHYVLDRRTHPYIFYSTLFDSHENKPKEYARMHALFETYVDVLYREKYSYINSTFAMIKCNKEDIKVLSKMYYHLAKELFPFFPLEENSFYKAYKSMAFALKVLYSKKGFKKSFFDSFMKKSLINAMSHPRKLPEEVLKLDLLNNNKTYWKNPVTGDRFNSSFEELNELARRDFETVILAMDNKDFEAFLSSFVVDTDHRGCPINGRMTFKRNIFRNLNL